MTERALVTGAGGFVCRHIVDSLAAAGMTVLAVDRAFDDALVELWAGRSIQRIEADCRNLPKISVDYVVHGAAQTAGPDEAGQTPIENYRANLDPALEVLQWAADARARRTLVISSSAVFRNSPDPVYDEDTLPVSSGIYMAAKRAIELLAQTLRSEHGQDVVSIRLGSVYGPMEYARASRPRVSRVIKLLHEALTGRMLRVPRNGDRMDWTYAPDIGRAVLALLQAPTLNHDLYHVTSGEALTEFDLARAIAAVLPGTSVDLLDTPPAPHRGAMTGTRLTQDTGFSNWTPFNDGIASVLMWAQQESERAL